MGWRAILVLVAIAIATQLGCGRRPVQPELLALVDVVPADVGVGDRLEVLGVQLPAGDAKSARVVFEGDLHRPGRPPLREQKIVIEGAALSTDRVSIAVTEILQAKFCGAGDDAVHTTFRGRVIVSIPGVVAGVEVYGTVGGRDGEVVLDVAPPSRSSKARQEAERAAARALDFLGLELQEDSMTTGLVVRSVREGGPAALADLRPGDRLVSLEGVTLQDVTDVAPSGHERRPLFGVLRDDQPLMLVPVSLDGYRMSTGRDLLVSVILLGGLACLFLLGASPLSNVLGWLERRTAHRIARRRARGKRLSTRPSWLGEGARMILKDDLAPGAADQLVYRLAPYLVFIGVSATFVAMPFGHYLVAAEVDIPVLFLVSVTSLLTVGLLTGGYASASRWSVWGSLRSVVQIVSCEMPSLIALGCIVFQTGSLGAQEIVTAQSPLGSSLLTTGSWPWQWNAFQSPVAFALFACFFSSALIEGNRAAFELPGADSDQAGKAPHAGLRYLFFFFAEWAHIFVMCGLASVVFLGGWSLPGVGPSAQAESVALQLAGAVLFLAKSWVLIALFVWVRWTVPRLPAPVMTKLCWTWIIPASIATALLVIALDRARLEPAVTLAIRAITLGVFALFVGSLPFRVRARLAEEEKSPPHLRAFL